jgi:DNA repair exonuclease SbcCD nuclease subunit
VDLVVHGGDLLYRSRVPARLVEMAFAPLRRVADAGVPVFLVPGNHERSHIPYALLAMHRNIHVFDRPRAYSIDVRGCDVTLVGFPYCRDGIRDRFRDLEARASAGAAHGNIRLLCMHHCFEGATVGPHDYTFRRAPDVVQASDVPRGYAAVLSGHIHRFQILTTDLRGRALCAPVFYPGSIERTSHAEAGEPKGFLLLTLSRDQTLGGRLHDWLFCPLPTRPMLPGIAARVAT